jgi:hypothetical protein
MELKLTLLTGLMVASLPQLASAQTLFVAECAAPVQGVSVNSGLVTLQSQVVSTRTIPVAARLLSSRVVATGWAPTTPVNSLSTVGTASVPMATSFVRNSAATVQLFRPTGYDFRRAVDRWVSNDVRSSVKFHAGSSDCYERSVCRVASGGQCSGDSDFPRELSIVHRSTSKCLNFMLFCEISPEPVEPTRSVGRETRSP